MSEYKIYFSTRPEKRMGSEEVWDTAENALEQALRGLNLDYTLNPGDGAFYGPKLDIMFVDALKRPWQLGTLQCDFNMPKAFDLKYTGDDNTDHRPIMLHRAILGSLGRFLAVYLEHCGGKLPTWLAPVQVKIMNVTSNQEDYCHEILKELKDQGVRADFDDRGEKLGYKIREAQLKKIPYMLTIGDREKDNETVSLRLLDGQTVNGLKKSDFIENLNSEIRLRKLESPFKDSSHQEVKDS